MNEKLSILIEISLKFVPKRPIDNNPALVPIMAWRQKGDKPFSEAMLNRSTIHGRIYVALGGDELHRPQLVVQDVYH